MNSLLQANDRYGISPLLSAIYEGHTECVKILLQKVCYYLLTYLCLFARWEHRPSTKERHSFLSVAIVSISLLVYPISFVSFSMSLCQVFRGLPLPGGGGSHVVTDDCFWWFPECMSYPPPF